MRRKGHTGPFPLTLYHNAWSDQSFKAITAVQRALRGIDRLEKERTLAAAATAAAAPAPAPQANTQADAQGHIASNKDVGPGMAYLDEASSVDPKKHQLDVQFEVIDRSRVKPTEWQMFTIYNYLYATAHSGLAESVRGPETAAAAQVEPPPAAASAASTGDPSKPAVPVHRQQQQEHPAVMGTPSGPDTSSAASLSSQAGKGGGPVRPRDQERDRKMRKLKEELAIREAEQLKKKKQMEEQKRREAEAAAGVDATTTTKSVEGSPEYKARTAKLQQTLDGADFILVDWLNGRATADLQGVHDLLARLRMEQDDPSLREGSLGEDGRGCLLL